MSEEVVNCDLCRFSDLHPDADHLLVCRRKCPIQTNNVHHAIWPIVKLTDWCGDFEEMIDG
jgi:hypothetical protein